MVERPHDPVLGLESGRARLMPYQPRWRELFEEEAERIRAAAGGGVLEVEHIGSTAIPGMPAKPILDLMAAVPSREAGLGLVPALAGLGYEHRPDPDIPERVYLRKRFPSGVRTHHLSLAEPSSRFYRVQLCFRDHLREHPDAAREYAALKTALAESHAHERERYTEGKTAFVLGVLRRAGCG